MIELRDYQEKLSNSAASILSEFRIVILAAEVRTGKTLTSLATASKYGAKNVLFVTKKKAIGSIKNDYDLLKPDFKICIVNYESVHKIDFIPDFVIVDESHSLGAFPKPSNRTKELKKIVGNLPLILMSGTVTPESYSQIYHQLWISENSPFKTYVNFYKWAKIFVNPQKKYLYSREINDYSNAKIESIEPIIEPYLLTFTQKEAGFEFEVDENILNCDMIPELNQLINVIIRDRCYRMIDGSLILADTAVKLQQKIHQISSGTVKDEDGNTHILDNSKANFIRDFFNGKKIAIFYKFKAEFELLRSVFTNYTESPEEFQNELNFVFLGQFQSAREGIRLDSADALVFYNIDFSFLSYEQAKNRIISKDRKKKAPLYFIFNRKGIEPKIYKAVKNKSDYTNYYFKKDYHVRK